MRLLKSLLFVSAGCLVAALICQFTLHLLQAWVNISASLPYGLYQTSATGAPYARGELILTCLPPPAAQLANERSYVTVGSCTARTAPVGKYIVAIPGDRVEISLQGVRVNGHLLPNSQPSTVDGQGLPLQPAILHTILQDGEYLLLNPLLQSFDSRYCGIVRAELFVARLKALWVLE